MARQGGVLAEPVGAVTIGMPQGRGPFEVRPDLAVRRCANLTHDAERMAREIIVLFGRRMRS